VSGVTDQGFELKTLNVILDEINAQLQADLGADVNTGADSVLGVVVGAPAIQIASTWEAIEQVAHAYDPDQAVGAQLDAIAAFNGLRRQGAVAATGTITIAGTNGTIIPAGSLVRDPTAEVTTRTTLSATISGGVATIPVVATVEGAVNSVANGITIIVTPVAGWTSITASTLTGGQDRESDFALRARIASSSQTTASVEGAIRAALLGIEGVTAAIVLSNRTLTTDGNGTPGKAFQAIISPDLAGQAQEAEIAEAIFRTQPAGILSAGIGPSAASAQVTDDQGFTQTVAWSYVVDLPTYYVLTVDVDLTVGALTTAQVEDLATQAIVAYVGGLAVGADVIVPGIVSALALAIPGLLGVTLALGDAPAPVGAANIAVAFNEIATVDTADIAVTVT
jgi:uncharacterized phage protein gp47/JayE